MALNKKPDVPATPRSAICSYNKECDNKAVTRIGFELEIMGKTIKCQKLVCQKHHDEFHKIKEPVNVPDSNS